MCTHMQQWKAVKVFYNLCAFEIAMNAFCALNFVNTLTAEVFITSTRGHPSRWHFTAPQLTPVAAR